jgi:molecular chaperone IbpA
MRCIRTGYTHFRPNPFWRSTIGFDRLFDLAEAAQQSGEDNYPPFNIQRLAEDRYQLTLAVVGFAPEESRSRPSRTS